MWKILQLIRNLGASTELVQNIPLDLQVFKLRIPNPPTDLPDGAVAVVTVKIESETVFISPEKNGLLLDSVPLQKQGFYECSPDNVLSMGDCSWTFSFVPVPHSSPYLQGPYVVPCKADKAPVQTLLDGQDLLQGSVLGRDLMKDSRQVPLWLPGHAEAVTPAAWIQRESFFSYARIKSSVYSEVARSFPYPAPLFAKSLKTLPGHVCSLELVIRDSSDVKYLKDCIKAASAAYNITSVSVDSSIDLTDMDISPQKDDWRRGNLNSFRWTNVNHVSLYNVFVAVLEMNPRVTKVAVGGLYTMYLLDNLRHRPVRALDIHLSAAKHSHTVLDILQPGGFELEELALYFQDAPDVQFLWKLYKRFHWSLIKVTIVVAKQQAHGQCDRRCHSRLFPSFMPRLQEVHIENLCCISSGINRVINIGNVKKLSIRGANGDASMFRNLYVPNPQHSRRFAVENLTVSPGWRARDLILSDENWDNLVCLTVENLQLADIPGALKLARRAVKLTLIIDPPSKQVLAPTLSVHDSETTTADKYFVGEHPGYNPLVWCTRLQELSVVFTTLVNDEWDHPTLGLNMFTRGVTKALQLRHVELNEISPSLANALNEEAHRTDQFTFKSTMHSAYERAIN